MFFSIIIPVCKAENALAGTVDSAVRQSLGDEEYEIVIIDDGAPDGGRMLQAQLPQRAGNLRLVRHETSLGPGVARNRGLEAARGRYVAFLEAGDQLRSDALEAFQRLAADLAYPEIVYAGQGFPWPSAALLGSRHLKGLAGKILRGERAGGAAGAIYQKAFLDEHGLRFAEGRFGEELEFTARCALLGRRVAGLDLELSCRRAGPKAALSRRELAEAAAAWGRLYRWLKSEGALGRHGRDWRVGLVNFMALAARRAVRPAGGRAGAELPRFFETELRASEVLAERNLTEELLAAARRAAAEEGRRGPAWAEVAAAAAGAVVMVADVDGQLRHLAAIARRLTALGVKSVVCDVSGSRALPCRRRPSRLEAAAYGDLPFFSFDRDDLYPLFAHARAYVLSCDWGWFRPLLFQLKRLQVPTIAFYEGLHDDEVLAPPAPPRRKERPYRHADYLFLPGAYYEPVYAKYRTTVVGLPALRALWEENAPGPAAPLAVINVNFSYGVLEEGRAQFLATAVEACRQARLPFVISRHPADSADLSPWRPSARTIYEDLRNGAVLISRFSTCILEALALGRPVIYHNPHGEKFPQYQGDPMGAFEVTVSAETLAAALEKVLAEVRAGVDFRPRAAAFLQRHTNIFAGDPPETLAARAILAIVERGAADYQERLLHLAAREAAPPRRQLNVRLLERYADAPWWKKCWVLLLLDRPRLKAFLLRKKRGAAVTALIKRLCD